MESNALCTDGEEVKEMIEMLRALEENKTLLSLNIGNNKLEVAIGTQIRRMLEKNHTIIDLEFGSNNFSLEDVSNALRFRDSNLHKTL